MLFPSLFVCRIKILVPKRHVAAKECEHVFFHECALYTTQNAATEFLFNFEQAQVMWHDQKAITLQAMTEPEARFVRIVGFSGAIWRIVYTIRNENIRLISVSRAKRSEEKLYGQS
jgi:uncharacterized DUF497 family protein